MVSANSSTSAGGLARADNGDPADEEGGDPAHGGQIRPHGRGDRGTLHFHHHLLAGVEGGGVHLGDGRGGERLPVELREDVLERTAQVLLHHLAGPPRTTRGVPGRGGGGTR